MYLKVLPARPIWSIQDFRFEVEIDEGGADYQRIRCQKFGHQLVRQADCGAFRSVQGLRRFVDTGGEATFHMRERVGGEIAVDKLTCRGRRAQTLGKFDRNLGRQ
ncbi:hypothetical protein MAXJ12_24237 [Mesorhizobium alhagi CCNWXJ12-2]|uniref:Uncharacterized protein n=1 Tax=Mesorhizobium alhagi CCNWXJ12-2 TaxID=1107882 RepID=H0HXC8_9HYPH|nr:hypothetical protein MAXJ12_24237 [Mesorhizobium alhagi CCNWXJ12-2]